MAVVFEEISMRGMKRADLSQLLSYINDIETDGIYWGNREQFWARHARIKTLIENAVDYAYSDGVVMPRIKKGGN